MSWPDSGEFVTALVCIDPVILNCIKHKMSKPDHLVPVGVV
jgi:hypothetical protein